MIAAVLLLYATFKVHFHTAKVVVVQATSAILCDNNGPKMI